MRAYSMHEHPTRCAGVVVAQNCDSGVRCGDSQQISDSTASNVNLELAFRPSVYAWCKRLTAYNRCV